MIIYFLPSSLKPLIANPTLTILINLLKLLTCIPNIPLCTKALGANNSYWGKQNNVFRISVKLTLTGQCYIKAFLAGFLYYKLFGLRFFKLSCRKRHTHKKTRRQIEYYIVIVE